MKKLGLMILILVSASACMKEKDSNEILNIVFDQYINKWYCSASLTEPSTIGISSKMRELSVLEVEMALESLDETPIKEHVLNQERFDIEECRVMTYCILLKDSLSGSSVPVDISFSAIYRSPKSAVLAVKVFRGPGTMNEVLLVLSKTGNIWKLHKEIPIAVS